MKNVKKLVAGMILILVTVCMVSPIVFAANQIIQKGSRKQDSAGYYYSYTKVSAYDSNGYGLNLTVGAKIGNGSWIYATNSGSVSVNSAAQKNKANAYHSYRVGSGSETVWVEN